MTANTSNVEWFWTIRSLKVQKSEDSLTNVVKEAHWQLEAEYIDIDTKEHYYKGYTGKTLLPSPEANNFVELTEITTNNVIQWIESIESTTEKVFSEHNSVSGLSYNTKTGEMRLDYFKRRVLERINQQIDEEEFDYTVPTE